MKQIEITGKWKTNLGTTQKDVERSPWIEHGRGRNYRVSPSSTL